MAKNDKAPENEAATPTPGLDGIEFDEYVPTQVAGVYDRHVEAMLAKDKLIEENEPDEYAAGKRTRVKISVGADDVEKEVRKFQDSARKRGKTGRHVGTEPQGDGGVKLLFVLGVRQSRPRKPKPETDTADVPTEVTETATDSQEQTEDAAA